MKAGVLACLLSVTTIAFVPAADCLPQQGGSATFRSRTDLVVVHVTVVDKKTGFVSGLQRDDFIVYEDGRPQPIRFFLAEDTPVTIGLVIDNSASMRRRRDQVIAAGLAFARASHPQDEMFTVNFNERVWPGLEPPRLFTSSLASLEQALQRTIARGQTALFDAVLFGLEHLDRGAAPKKALVVLSDGDDNASKATVNEVLAAAHRTDAAIYTVWLYEDRGDSNPRLLRSISAATGGEMVSPRDPDDLVPTLVRVAKSIRSSYTIGYAPTEPGDEGRFHPIRVSARTAHPGRVSVRTRSGYVSGARETANVR